MSIRQVAERVAHPMPDLDAAPAPPVVQPPPKPVEMIAPTMYVIKFAKVIQALIGLLATRALYGVLSGAALLSVFYVTLQILDEPTPLRMGTAAGYAFFVVAVLFYRKPAPTIVQHQPQATE